MMHSNQVWRHKKTGGLYQIVAIGPIKENGKWSETLVVAYRNMEGSVFFRHEANFRESFTREERTNLYDDTGEL